MLMDLMQNKHTKSGVFANYITAHIVNGIIMRVCKPLLLGAPTL